MRNSWRNSPTERRRAQRRWDTEMTIAPMPQQHVDHSSTDEDPECELNDLSVQNGPSAQSAFCT
jgi:hypothetical protein